MVKFRVLPENKGRGVGHTDLLPGGGHQTDQLNVACTCGGNGRGRGKAFGGAVVQLDISAHLGLPDRRRWKEKSVVEADRAMEVTAVLAAICSGVSRG